MVPGTVLGAANLVVKKVLASFSSHFRERLTSTPNKYINNFKRSKLFGKQVRKQLEGD
jgi:hypothetical protein